MKNFFSSINRSFNGLINTLITGAFILIFFAVIIVFVDYALRFIIAFSILAVAAIFFYAAYKLYIFKKHIKDFLPRIK